MPFRYETFANEGIYHVFNKSIHLDVFKSESLALNFLYLVKYYKSKESTLSYSKLMKIEARERAYILKDVYKPENDRVKIIAFALMPNHFHFIFEQVLENGVVDTISNAVNSFTKSYNIKNDTLGPIFLPRFKAVSIDSEEQLHHTVRYVHINHTTSKLITKKQLLDYPLNSFSEYMNNPKNRLTDETRILGLNPNSKGRQDYKKATFSRIKYQQDLHLVKALD